MSSGTKRICSALILVNTIIVIGRLTSGAGAALSLKGMNEIPLPEIPGYVDGQKFNHPWMQVLVMFIGEFGCIFVFLGITLIDKKKGRTYEIPEGKKKFKFFPHVFFFIPPTICDLTSSFLFNMGIYYALASVQQMLRNLTTLFIATLSACIWRDYRQKFDLPQGIGLLILVIGAFTITASTVFFSEQQTSAPNPILGAILVIIGCLFSALFQITEEISLRRVFVHTASLGVSCEGGWGLILVAILLPIFNVVNDPFTSGSGKKMENSRLWYLQTQSSVGLSCIIAAYVIFTLLANWSGMEVTNRLSAAARATFDGIRVIIVWIVSFIVSWETWHNQATPVRLIGFVCVFIGSLMYNNVIRWIPYLKQMNKEKYGPVCNCCKKNANAIMQSPQQYAETDIMTEENLLARNTPV